MPDTDGFAVAAMIRDRAQLAGTRIVMLTSGDRPGDSAKIRDLQIDAHLLKPVREDELLDTLFRVMSAIGSSESSTPAASPATARPGEASLRILVAEDNELSAQVVQQLLQRQGHRVQLVDNGRDALAMAQHGGFDLALIDVQMPEIDGIEVVQTLRRHEQATSGRLPIIALTARSRRQDREGCMAAGMDEFVTKPIAAPELLAAIGRVMRSRTAGTE
jgi:CheY-like chemotaxis protein